MALTNTTQFANRYGLDIKILALGTDTAAEDALMTIDFANVCDVDISGDRVWATGGQGHVNKIAFNDPIQGTFKISTQILTAQLLALMAGNDLSVAGDTNEIVFQNTDNATPTYYTVVATTVWQDASGTTYSETLTFHKVCPKRALNISYSGEGDPTSVDIEFDVLQADDGKVLTIVKA